MHPSMASFKFCKHKSAAAGNHLNSTAIRFLFKKANITMTKRSKTYPGEVPPAGKGKQSSKWNDRIIGILIDAVQERAKQGACNGNNLTKEGWRAVAEKLRAITALNHDNVEIKNKLGVLHRNGLLWYKLFREKSCLASNNIEPSNDWWRGKFRKNPKAARFQYGCLKFVLKLTSLFPSGAYRLVSSTSILPHDQEQGYNCQNLVSLESHDTIEGSGDSEDPDFGASGSSGFSSGTSFGLGNLTLNKSKSSLLSGEKKKQGGAMVTEGGKQGINVAAESHTSGSRISRAHGDDNPY